MNTTGDPDALLLQRVARRDRDAHRDLCRKHHTRIRYIARNKGLPDADCEEVVMDTYLAIWNSAGHYRGDAPVSAWIAAIASNKARTRMRDQAREAQHFVHQEIDDNEEDPVDRTRDDSFLGASPEWLAQRTQLQDCIARCFGALSPTLREVAADYWIGELKETEIAADRGIPLNTVKSRKIAARQKLWPCLTQCREAAT